jgi:L-lactate dehydrogenase complex protein LldF
MSDPTAPFPRRVTKALRDPILHRALDNATRGYSDKRLNVLASLPDPDRLRDYARRVRAHTISRLNEYLSQFAEAATAVGAHIHWAADAAQARQIVLELAQANDVKTVVKSKSMISEEIHLNPTLEDAGLQVIESDLGEYIIQLAGETPSHIVVPAIHKTKEQVGELFQQHLGLPYTNDPAIMTAAAREELRKVFLSAEMGISGVNFGVAETGTICLVTNEGNGRLTTTLPRLHVALMGIERLAPNIDDLSVLLQLLARSSTGQKLTVYTNMLTGPRQHDEDDGPDELHIVLVDNGRSRVLGTKIAEILYCIRCGACLNACPVYREIGGHAYGSVYPGPVGSVLTPALWGVGDWAELPHACSLCGACRDACPMRIDLPHLLLELRDEGVRQHTSPWWLRIGIPGFRFGATSATRFNLASHAASIVSRLVSRDGWIRHLPPPLSGWTDHRDFPTLAPKPFSQRWKERENERR